MQTVMFKCSTIGSLLDSNSSLQSTAKLLPEVAMTMMMVGSNDKIKESLCKSKLMSLV